MQLKFHAGGSDESVEFVKGILPLIGNVQGFEVYGSREQTPYVETVNGHQHRYTCILRDDRGNEVWLPTLCGYGGAGAFATRRILQIIGLKDDYRIEDRQQIKETGLKPVHRLRLLVGGAAGASLRFVGRFWIAMEFKYAYQLSRVRTALQALGSGHPAEDMRGVRIPPFLTSDSTGPEVPDCVTNLAFRVNLPLPELLSDEALQALFRSIAEENGGAPVLYDLEGNPI